MLRKFAVVLTGLVLLGTVLHAQDAKETEKTTKKKATTKEKKSEKASAKGTPYTVVRVDAKAGTIAVKDADGKASTLTVTDRTAIKGPRGGRSDGLADKRLVPGATIRVVREGGSVTAVYLPTRSRKAGDKSAASKDTKAKKTETADDTPVEKPKSKKSKKKDKAPEKSDEKPKEKAKTEDKSK